MEQLQADAGELKLILIIYKLNNVGLKMMKLPEQIKLFYITDRPNAGS